ncbi:hypothetical protein [Pelagicoccus mobilis]|uniref:Uncharacterized protein n=1 Tax=Pelagicoccus mobilis TaxID=415221 RepID=A0A934RVQ2_9BACT|nr:hypothetical protein [Pelagicoccus mobilis]MBK1877258.1 hypothetical protein [Pelagicoccus mobilis]
MEIRSTLIANGWKQGSLLDDDLASALYPGEEGVAVVVTQDCDLVCQNFDSEPVFETLFFKKSKKLRSKYEGKHPRVFNCILLVDGEEQVYQTSIASRKLHPRSDHLLSSKSRENSGAFGKSREKLKYWMAKKYDRYGRPEMFDAALRPTKALDQIDAVMTESADYVDSLYLSISPDGDLEVGEKYVLKILMLYDLPDAYDEESAALNRNIAERVAEAAHEVQRILSEVEELDQEKLDVDFEAKQQTYVSELSEYHYFDYDYLSADIDAEAKTLPEL